MPWIQPGVLAAVLDVGDRDKPAQVAVALTGLGQQRQMGAVGQGYFSAGNGLDARIPGALCEVHRSAQVVVVSKRQGRVVQLPGLLQQLLDGRGPFFERVVAVAVEFDVGHGPVSLAVYTTGPRSDPKRWSFPLYLSWRPDSTSGRSSWTATIPYRLPRPRELCLSAIPSCPLQCSGAGGAGSPAL